MNESWGVHEIETDRMQQHFTEMIYHLTKSLDPYRPVIVNDGWEHTVSDILTLHDYEEVGETLYKRYTCLLYTSAKENEIVVKVEDSFDPQQPRGKQRWVKDSFGCWYVQTTGIWKTVWME